MGNDVVILDWPEGMPDEIVDEVVEATGIDEGTAELAVDIVAARVVEAIDAGLLEVTSREGGDGR
jgi:hypothetical protein